MARAKLGDRSGHREASQLHFHKWHSGGWNQEGRGGLEEGVTPPCGVAYGEGGAQISYNDALRRYMMTFVCTAYRCAPNGRCEPSELSLFYSTATNLAVQDWTAPRPIENSTRRYVADPKGGWIIDGGYPSFVSPGCEAGHLGLSGSVFLLKGNPLPTRQFVSRSFTIRPADGTPLSANGCHRNR